jgi:hypothetical protein
LRIIVIELYSIGGFPFEEESELGLISIKVSFWCCGSLYIVVPLKFATIFLFLLIIIHMVPKNWYNMGDLDDIDDFWLHPTIKVMSMLCDG